MANPGAMELIQAIHQVRTPFWDSFFKLLSFFDRQEFFFILIPLVWFILGWKRGFQFLLILTCSSLSNQGLKELFALPRPCQLDPSLGMISVSGYGFPSGAAQTAVLLSGILVYHVRRLWAWVVGICFLLLLSFSRLYLEVHFLRDILGGWVVGGVLWGVYTYLFPKWEKSLSRKNPILLLAGYQLAFLVLILLGFRLSLCAIAMGVGLGLGIAHFRHWKEQFPRRKLMLAIRGVAGLLGVFVCESFLSWALSSSGSLGVFLHFFVLGFVLSLAGYWMTFLTKRLLGHVGGK